MRSDVYSDWFRIDPSEVERGAYFSLKFKLLK